MRSGPRRRETRLFGRKYCWTDFTFRQVKSTGATAITCAWPSSDFQNYKKLPASGVVDQATWQQLDADSSPALVPYTISPDDVKGPFVKIPSDMQEKAKLDALGYESPEEGIGEKFHIDPDLLKDLNPGKNLGNAGEQIMVPNVQRSPSPVKAARVEVSKSQRTVIAYSPDEKILAQYPRLSAASTTHSRSETGRLPSSR